MRIWFSPMAWATLATVGAAALGVSLGAGEPTAALHGAAPTPPSPVASAARQSTPQDPAMGAVQPVGACGGSAQANPFAAQEQCTSAGSTGSAGLPNTLPELRQALDSVDPCAAQGAACRRNAHPFEGTLVHQLETLALGNEPGVRVTLALQLQRQRGREGLQVQDAQDLGQDATLQRSVALLAEAAAAGDPQALAYRESLGAEGARLLHTGR